MGAHAVLFRRSGGGSGHGKGSSGRDAAGIPRSGHCGRAQYGQYGERSNRQRVQGGHGSARRDGPMPKMAAAVVWRWEEMTHMRAKYSLPLTPCKEQGARLVPLADLRICEFGGVFIDPCEKIVGERE
jgi:hypothetical protein